MLFKKAIMVLIVVVLVAAGVKGYTVAAEQTPEYAMEQAMEAVAARDTAKLSRYADVEGIVTAVYDEGTGIMARDIARLHEMYPADWFFRHDTAFMTDYIAARRSDDLALINRSIELYADDDIVPIGRRDGDAKYIADEAADLAPHYSAKLDSVTKDEAGIATARVTIEGDATDYGRLLPELTLTLRLEPQEDGHYRITSVTNVAEAFDPTVKAIEDYCTLKGIQ